MWNDSYTTNLRGCSNPWVGRSATSRSQALGEQEVTMAISGGRLVLIEDDDGMREAIESLLDAAGFRTTVYTSAEALLASDTLDDVRCIVSDVRLPAMSGLDLLAALRARGASPPVILITAHDSPAMRGEAVRRGAAAYLPKPFAGTALLDTIARVGR